jgi:hypothetical protein
MNKRIKELMAEADRRCSETRGIYDEILAELIVKDSICQIEKQAYGLTSTEWDQGFLAGLRTAQAVLKNFGVEYAGS